MGTDLTQHDLRERLLRRRLDGRGPGTRGIPRVDRSSPLVLSHGQEQMWLLAQLEPDSAEYLVPVAVRVRGRLDLDALSGAWARLVARHEILRTRYAFVDGAPRQVIDPPDGGDPLPLVDLTGDADPDGRLAEIVRTEATTPFDLANRWPARARVVRTAADDHVVMVVFHHVAFDAWSTGIVVGELSALYRELVGYGDADLPVLPVQYADYAAWQRAQVSAGGLDRQLDYWRTRLAGLEPLDLPADRARPAVRDADGTEEAFTVPDELARRVRAYAARAGVTPFVVLLSAFHVLVGRYAGRTDVAVGTVMSGRTRAELRDLIGYGITTLVLRGRWDPSDTFADLVARNHTAVVDAYDNQAVPFARLLDELAPERDLSRSPLYQVAFTMHRRGAAALELGTAHAEPFGMTSGIAKCDLELQVDDRPDGGLGAQFVYATALFDADRVRRMAEHLVRLLDAALSDADVPVSRLRLLGDAELRLLTRDAQDSPAAVLTDLFERQVSATPDAPAVTAGDQTLTYTELDARANQLAHHLRAHGAGPESVVGIHLDRGPDLLPTILGVLKSGAAYLPLDPINPTDRLRYILDDAGADLLVTTSGHHLPHAGTTVHIGDEADRPTTAPMPVTDPHNLAYVIYTSGSTGRPKGVAITHTNITRLLATANRHFGFTGDDVVTMTHSYAFDVSVFEMWAALLHGGHLHVVPSETTRSPEDLADLVTEHGVTLLSQTPTAFGTLAPELATRPRADLRLRAIVFAGERLDYPQLRPWADHAGLDQPWLVNMYGITETTVHSTFHRVTPEDLDGRHANAVGYPLSDTTITLLDGSGELVPAGVPGEIHVAGPALARGYHHRPALTAARFTPNPSGPPGSRHYTSGDLAHHDTTGALHFHTRADNQIKIRGYRIELGEIHTAITDHPGVTHAHVTTRTGAGTPQLIAYVTTDGSDPDLVASLRGHLATALPPYMIPAHIETLDRFPLTPNGKLDKARLPEPSGTARGPDRVAPETALEQRVAAVWATVLDVPGIGVTDGFFDVGGDSIRAVALAGALRADGLAVTVGDVLRDRTVRELARNIDPTATPAIAATAPFALLTAADRERLPADAVDAYPLTRNQLGMLVEMLADTAESSYHNVSTSIVRDVKPLCGPALDAAVAELARRHETLRTSAHLTTYSVPLQVVHADPAVPVELADLGALTGDGQRAAIGAFVAAERARVFTVDTGTPMVRVSAHDLGEGWALTWTHAHAVLDGWSLALLRDELVRLYHAARDGEPMPEHVPASVRFADTVAAELAALDDAGDREHWNALTATHQPARLPAHWAGDGSGTEVSAHADYRDLVPALRELARACDVSLKTVLLAAHTKVLSQVSPEARVHTGLVTHTRPEAPGAERLCGLHLNTLPHPVDRSARTWAELLTITHAHETRAWAHRHYPMPRIQQDAGQGRLVDVMFNFLDTAAQRSDGVDTVINRAPKEFALSVNAADGVVSLHGTTRALDQVHADRLAGMYRAVLEAMAADGDGDARCLRVPDAERALLPTAAHDARCLPVPDPERAVRHSVTERAPSGIDVLVRLFERQVSATPDAPAVTAGDQTLTYTELDARANRLAHHLRAHGAGPESVVGIHLDRGPDLLPTVLGVLKAGAAYLPLDPINPTDRLRYILDDAGADLLVTTSGHHLPHPGTTIHIGDEADRPTAAPMPVTDPDNLAYVIYTSGSTGRPKGVAITHANVTRLLHTADRHLGFGPEDTWSMVHSYAFDVSVFEMWGALLHGGHLVVVPADTTRDPESLAEHLVRHGVSVLSQTPTAFGTLTGALTRRPLADLRLRAIVFAGERLDYPQLRPWADHAGLDQPWLVNMYGITETTVHSTFHRVTPEDLENRHDNPVGYPLADTTITLLDTCGELVPTDVPGEIHVAGPALARGYHHRPALTAARFSPNPWGPPGSRHYTSGDLAHHDPHGALHFHTRADNQIKIRGYRIELGEIHTAVTDHPGVTHAHVTTRTGAGTPQLIAYVTTERPDPALPAELRAHLATVLPPYMVPAHVLPIDRFPLTPNGKLDKARLPEPVAAMADGPVAPPSTPRQEVLARIWADVLGVPQVGVDQDFFELGGDSVRAVALVARAERAGLEISVFDVYRHRTVAALADGAGAGPVRTAPRAGDVPDPAAAMTAAGVPGASVALLRHGELVAAEGFGVLRAGGAEPVTPSTPFQAGSISKHVTALAVLALVARGRLDLDADIAGYLTGWRVPGAGADRPITVAQLLGHRSGLRAVEGTGYRPGRVPTLLDVLDGRAPAVNRPVVAELPPGDRMQQANVHFVVLQQLLQDVTGRPFAELARELVLDPLGMHDSGFDQDDPPGDPAVGHDGDGRPLDDGWLRRPDAAAAGLWTTAGDLATAAQQLRRSVLGLPRARLRRDLAERAVTAYGDTGYGLGTVVEGSVVEGSVAEGSGPDRRFGHGGHTTGYAAMFRCDLASGDGWVVLTNGDAGDAVVRALLDAGLDPAATPAPEAGGPR